MEEMTEQLRGMFANLGGGKKKAKKLRIADAHKLLIEEEAAKLVNDDDIKAQALATAEQNGIVLIDAIDHVAPALGDRRASMSRARAYSATRCRWSKAPPSTPSTAWSTTDHILFIVLGWQFRPGQAGAIS